MGKEFGLGSPISLAVLPDEDLDGFYRKRMIFLRLRGIQTRTELPPDTPGAALLDRAIRTTRSDIKHHSGHGEGISDLSVSDVLESGLVNGEIKQ